MPYTVLIVDDQKDISRLLRSAIETIEQGIQVFEAPSGEEAMLEASRRKFDLLVADYRLPGMTGIELMKKLKGRNESMRTIIISGVSDSKSRKEIDASGADTFFSKPVSMSDFLSALERLLGMERTVITASEPAPAEKAAAPERKTLADMVVHFRKQVNADAVILFNDRGRAVAKAGDLPDPTLENALTPALMTVYSAAQKISLLAEHDANADLHFFRGGKFDLVFAPIGLVHAILISGKGLATGDTLKKTVDILSAAQGEMETALKNLRNTGTLSPETVQAYEEKQQQMAPPPEEPIEIPEDFMALLGQAGEKKQDLNAFWDEAVDKGPAFTLKDTLSFEEANKLGLAPDKDS